MKPQNYDRWPLYIRALYDKAADEDVEAFNALVATMKSAESASDSLAAIEALTELGGPQFQEDLRRAAQRQDPDGRKFIEVVMKLAQEPGLTEDERREIEDLLNRAMAGLPNLPGHRKA
jgi:hypothetical protein